MKPRKNEQISSTVMAKIKNNEIKMRPKSYYVLISLISMILVISLSLFIGYLINILILWLRIEASEGRALGARYNLNQLIESFPLWTIPAITISIFLTFLLISKRGRLYKIKKSYIFGLILLASLIIGLTMNISGVNKNHNYGSKKYDSQHQGLQQGQKNKNK